MGGKIISTLPNFPKPFSYVDSALCFPYFNFEAEAIMRQGIDLEHLAERHDSNRSEFKSKIMEFSLNLLLEHNKEIFWHELHHCLQSLFYPYQYLQSWRELSIAFNLLEYLRTDKKSSRALKAQAFSMDKASQNTIRCSCSVYGINIGSNGLLEWAPNRELDDMHPSDLTLVDLLEDATSIFQFKVSIDADGGGEEYLKWVRNQRSYSNTFKLLVKILGVEFAYNSLPPLVQAAFQTTWPMTTFVNMANNLKLLTERHPEIANLGCDQIYDMLINYLEKETYCQKGMPNIGLPTQSDQWMYINLENFSKLVEKTNKHTIHSLATNHLNILRQDPSWKFVLYHAPKGPILELFALQFLPALT